MLRPGDVMLNTEDPERPMHSRQESFGNTSASQAENASSILVARSKNLCLKPKSCQWLQLAISDQW
jgi:hypothetical protein